jgi:glucose/arabinose dehydrogenase
MSFVLLVGACFRFLPGDGGGQTAVRVPRAIKPADIARPQGYEVEPVMVGFTFPTAVLFDDQGAVFVIEAGYSYGESFTVPRLLRLEEGNRTSVVAEGKKSEGPWTGGVFHAGAFYIADGGSPGRILKVELDGRKRVLVDGIPSRGDHHVNGPVVGPDGKLYFSVGTITNSGVVGEDNYKFGWLKRKPKLHDVACRDITLKGENFRSLNPLTEDADDTATTGAFVPFGTSTEAGQVIAGELPCSGAVLRVGLDGEGLELVAWGFRNPFGLRFLPDGYLYVSDNGYDVRGSRPVFGSADWLWRVNPETPGLWYGWPDFVGGVEIGTHGHQPPFGPKPAPILKTHPNKPPEPIVEFPVHASATGMDYSTNDEFGYQGKLFVALFGDMAPAAGKTLDPVGYEVLIVDVDRGLTEAFLTNKGQKSAPASYLNGGGLERPVDVKFAPDGRALYVVDFGIVQMGDDEGTFPKARTGALWKVTRGGTEQVAWGEP